MSDKDGGSAFPLVWEIAVPADAPAGTVKALKIEHGLTLRDYFAAKAMAECLQVAADQSPDDTPLSEVFGKATEYAYHYADAMLKERAK